MSAEQRADLAISARGIEKSFKGLHVLRGVDLDVRAGSIVALLGSNGAGKTTLVRILSTLTAADAGTAMVNGFDVASEGGSRSARPAAGRRASTRAACDVGSTSR